LYFYLSRTNLLTNSTFKDENDYLSFKERGLLMAPLTFTTDTHPFEITILPLPFTLPHPRNHPYPGQNPTPPNYYYAFLFQAFLSSLSLFLSIILSSSSSHIFGLLMYVNELGLVPLTHAIYDMVNKATLSTFVERWHRDTISFHLIVKKKTITLDDAFCLIHLPIV